MKILIACEFSGIVRDAFIARGHNAVSCDLLPSERPGPHIIGNALTVCRQGWDMMISHWPCTRLCNSGVRWLYRDGNKTNGIDPVKWSEMVESAEKFRDLLSAPVPLIAAENPIMHSYAAGIIGVRQSQIIQPWQFGHGEIKATAFWLKGLPKLESTFIVSERNPRVHFASPGPERWKYRSRTLSGIADAMASQWGK